MTAPDRSAWLVIAVLLQLGRPESSLRLRARSDEGHTATRERDVRPDTDFADATSSEDGTFAPARRGSDQQVSSGRTEGRYPLPTTDGTGVHGRHGASFRAESGQP
ncbi:hypothetical protein GCM10009610_34930 [Pseudonocardia xinjiangensis]